MLLTQPIQFTIRCRNKENVRLGISVLFMFYVLKEKKYCNTLSWIFLAIKYLQEQNLVQ